MVALHQLAELCESPRAKGACMACHAAEKVGFINDQPLFRRLQPQP